MVAADTRFDERLKALTHPVRVRAFDAFSNPRGRIATTGQVAAELGITIDQLQRWEL